MDKNNNIDQNKDTIGCTMTFCTFAPPLYAISCVLLSARSNHAHRLKMADRLVPRKSIKSISVQKEAGRLCVKAVTEPDSAESTEITERPGPKLRKMANNYDLPIPVLIKLCYVF